MLSIRPGQLEPLPVEKVVNSGRLAEEGVIDPLVVNRRGFRAAVGAVALLDEGTIYGIDTSGKAYLVAAQALKVAFVVCSREFRRVLGGSAPEHENRRRSFYRTQDRPVYLSRPRKMPVDDVTWRLRIRKCLLGDGTSSTLQFADDGCGKHRKRRGWQANNLPLRRVEIEALDEYADQEDQMKGAHGARIQLC
jgi:hypothetical protein